MINKLDGEGFTEDDVRMMHPFNVFCGTSLDNAKLYKNNRPNNWIQNRFTSYSPYLQ